MVRLGERLGDDAGGVAGDRVGAEGLFAVGVLRREYALPGEGAVEELVGLEGVGGLQEGEVRAAVDGDAGGEGAEFEGGQGVQAGLQGLGVGGGAEEAEDGPGGGEGDEVRGEGGGVPVVVEDYLWRGGCGCGGAEGWGGEDEGEED